MFSKEKATFIVVLNSRKNQRSIEFDMLELRDHQSKVVGDSSSTKDSRTRINRFPKCNPVKIENSNKHEFSVS